MRKLLLAAAVAMIGLLPVAGHAQQQQQPQQQHQTHKPGDMFGMHSSQVVAIGVGALGGVLVAEAVIVSMPVWAGALAGGLVGNWWYSQQVEEMKATATRRAAAIADEAKLYLIGANDYASAGVGSLGQWWTSRSE